MYEAITLQTIEEMSLEDQAIALAALKGQALSYDWSVETKYGEFISDRGNQWVAKIAVQGYVPLFAAIDEHSELRAFLKAFQAAMMTMGRTA